MVGATKSQTKADTIRLSTLSDIGCIPCLIKGWPDVPATIQHVTDCGRRAEDEHQETYGSCEWHHLGVLPSSAFGSIDRATKALGPSFHHNKKAFEYRYGPETKLVKIADALVRMVWRACEKGEYINGAEKAKLTKALYKEIVLGIPPRRIV